MTGIEGVLKRKLLNNVDSRGFLSEIYRADWPGVPRLLQFNCVNTAAKTLRGMHVHDDHTDYVFPLIGTFELMLFDVRAASRTFRMRHTELLRADEPIAVTIPPGVAHGFYSESGAVICYGMDKVWSGEGDLCIRWDDPEMALPWSNRAPVVSERDRAGRSLAEILLAQAAHRAM